MNIDTKKIWEEKEQSIIQDQVGLYNQAQELILKAIHVCIIRDVMKEYRFGRAEKFREYNVVTTFSHVALENLAIQQLWKLFDKKKSVFHVWYVVKYMPHPKLKYWFKEQIKIIKPDIEYLSAWRNNFVAHWSKIAHFTPAEFEKKFEKVRGSEKRIKKFLLNLLCQMKFEMHRNSKEEQMKVFLDGLEDYRSFVENARDEILQKI